MSTTYQFSQPREQAVAVFKSMFPKMPIDWLEEQKLNTGYGVKIKGKYKERDFSVVIYFNKQDYATKIVWEKGAPELEQILAQRLQTKPSTQAGNALQTENTQTKATAQVEPITQAENSPKDLLISEAHIGTDESGKGDYFGPLVIAGVFLELDDAPFLRELGVADSKKISDTKIKEIAKKLRTYLKHRYNLVYINPEKYNQLYAQMGNLNKLLAWGHARVMENLLQTINCAYIIADKFGNDRYIQHALMQKGRQIKLIQTPRAEQDLAVAAASVLARDLFLTELEKLSQKYGVTFPKGCSEKVKVAGKKIVIEYGRAEIGKVAKLHFKTTQEIIDNL